MKILLFPTGYRPMQRRTHWCISQLVALPEPQFRELALPPIAEPAVARSLAAMLFLNDYSFDSILFLDDDIVFDPKDALKLVGHGLHGKHVVGGAYVTKTSKPQLASRFFAGQEVTFAPDSKPVEIMRLASGFMLVSRECMQKVAGRLPLCNIKENMAFRPVFMPYIKRDRMIFSKNYEYVTEDWSFSDRARDCGYKIWLDPSIRLGYMGAKEYVLEDATAPLLEKKESMTFSKEVVHADKREG